MQLSPRDSDQPPAPRLKHPVASSVALERDGGPVDHQAIELDDHAPVAPDAVALDPAPGDEEIRVDLGPRQAGFLQEGEEPRFELTAGESRAGGERGENCPNRRNAPPAGVTLDQVT